LTTPRNLPPTEIRGSEVASGCRFAVVVSRFNEEITAGLLAGARATLSAAGVSDADVTLVHVPGAFELPATALRLARTGEFDAIICLGCLIKGDTMHFEYIAEAASQGIMNVTVATGVPVAFGVLTTMTDEQAIVRSAPGDGNKGGEAARAAIDMATLFRRLGSQPRGEGA
jgi:6,7-dimethyl-8-ribityllumazine synthase